MNLILQGKLPVADWIEDLTNWLTHTFSGLFNLIQSVGNFIMDGITNTLLFVNPLLLIVLVTLAAFFLARKKWTLPTFTLLGLLFIYNPHAGKELLKPKLADVIDIFVKAGYEVVAYPTQAYRDAYKKIHYNYIER